MKNIKSRGLKLSALFLLSLLSACNSGSVSNSMASTTAPNGSYLKQLKQVPSNDNGMISLNNYTFKAAAGPTTYQSTTRILGSGITTITNESIEYFASNNCSGKPNYSYINSSPNVFPAEDLVTDNIINYNQCAWFESTGDSGNKNCFNELRKVNSIRYTYQYLTPESGQVSQCLANSNNSVIGGAGEVLANYESDLSCAVTSSSGVTSYSNCGFSYPYAINIYSGNSISESLVYPYGNMTVPKELSAPLVVTLNLNGAPGVQEFSVLPIVINNKTGLPESSIMVGNASSCVLQSTSAPFNESCSLNVMPSMATPIGSYTINFINTESFAFKVAPVQFNVSTTGYFTITNQSYIESMLLTRSGGYDGNWYCGDGRISPINFTIPPESSINCILTPTSNNIIVVFDVAGSLSNISGSVVYKCTGVGGCNESMSAVQFLVNAPQGFITESDESSVTFNSPACPTGSQFTSLVNNALSTGQGSVVFDNQSWDLSDESAVISGATFESAIINNNFFNTSVECSYNAQGNQINMMNYYASYSGSSYSFWSNTNGLMACGGGIGGNYDPTSCQFLFTQ